MYLSDVLTIPCNLAGLPGLSLPCGLDSKGLPIGAQLLAPPLAEPLLFRAARACEELVGFDQRPPEQDLAGGAGK
jgi:aspartyl-tRNA(Asn)/glutamyl-tRNA(Gln) amidotransferase subunit A